MVLVQSDDWLISPAGKELLSYTKHLFGAIAFIGPSIPAREFQMTKWDS